MLSILGPEDYHKAFVELDEDTLTGEKMVQAFAALKKLRAAYIDADAAGREWNRATGMVIDGKAGMQIMGYGPRASSPPPARWPARTTSACRSPAPRAASPTTSTRWPCSSSATRKTARPRSICARTVLEPEFQTLNQNKGLIPVRQDMDMSEFDACAQQSMKDFKAAAQDSGLQPSLAHGMAVGDVQGAVFDVVTNFFNDPKADPQKAAKNWRRRSRPCSNATGG
ncbi:Carbohydrate ABC transporter substrate-binding protein OS=Stutzerimonas stutzeri OX=316 GN=CXK95_18460 PE=3 SV=1 [Stutzerimonas stutzeri]